MSRTPLAFMSYVNDDDKFANGKITKFREHLSRAVKAHSGKPFEIFQDKKDIKWGQPWQERINDSLDATLFLIPIITPSFFNSHACRDELERFLGREKDIGGGDLILPVYYFDYPVLNDKEKLKQDPLVDIIAARQREDWRELWHHSFNTRKLNKALEKMARRIIEALEKSKAESARAAAARPASPQPEKESEEATSQSNTFQSDSGAQSIGQGEGAIGTQINNYYVQPPQDTKPQPASIAKTEPLTVIVEQHNRGHFKTITKAIQAVKSETRILVRPGVYKENIVIDKPIEIIGDGKRDDIVIQSRNEDAILFEASNGKVANLTLRTTGRGVFHGVSIMQGRLHLEDCDISSQSLACVAIHSGANPTLRRCCIRNGKAAGVFVYDNGQGTLEDNEIFANAKAGVEIIEGGNLTLRRNRITKNGGAGIRVHRKGGGTFEDNDLRGNAKGAWFVELGCEARVQRKGNKE
ncbi:right-handed parallel beta-helix repeat-containing protein [Desulfobulbus sp. F4]|nr:right-handed parallel beta-helix repeat-containing protein [Desulfobulbus sp. F4]